MARERWRAAVVGLWALSLVVVGGIGWFAARATLEPPEVEEVASEPATYTVVDGTIEHHFDFTAEASWPTTRVLPSVAVGIVTSIDVGAGDEVDAGAILFRVDERPVVIAEGTVPMYRDLAAGTSGRDVRQVQQFLVDLGYYNSEPSATFTTGTASAVRQWQRDLGIEADGVVAQGDIVFAPSLPVRVDIADDIAVGAQVSPRTDAVEMLAASPRFTLTLSEDQLDLIPLDAVIEVEHEDGGWRGRIESTEPTPEGDIDLLLTGDGGDPLCGDICLEAIPAGRPSHFRTRVVVIPESSGPLVPAAAIQTDAAGEAFVTDASGERVPVSITVRHSGHAIVEGTGAGAVIRLFGTTDDDSEESLDGADGADSGSQ